MHDLTEAVTRIVSELGVHTGIVQINVGSTGAIGAIEFKPGLEQDLPALLRRLIPPSSDYAHEPWHDGNSNSLLQATLLGPSLTVPLRERPARDRHLAANLSHRTNDVARERSVVVTVLENDQRTPGQRTGNGPTTVHDRGRRPNRGRYNFRHADDCSNHPGDAYKGIPLQNLRPSSPLRGPFVFRCVNAPSLDRRPGSNACAWNMAGTFALSVLQACCMK